MSLTPLEAGVVAVPESTVITPGHVWTGFEWVSPERYEQLRTFMNLPPIQEAPGNRTEDARGGVADVDLAKVETHVIAAAMEGTRVALPGAPPPPLGSWGIDAAWDKPPPPGLPSLAITASKPAPLRHDPSLISDFMKHDVIEQLLRLIIGEDSERGGLLETPARMVKAWQHWTSGYDKNPADILKVFEDGAEGVTEMVVVRDIPIYSKCEHHLADIFGTATIGYLPNGKIVGLSKLNRLADMFARRLQVQERMTNQIADALMEHLEPLGCGVVITARHMCMESRGVQQSSNTTTSALRGLFKDDPTVRAEFLALARN